LRPGQPRQVVGLIGYPLKHSISPRFQQAGFDFLGLPVTYEAWETPPERVAEAVARVRRPDCLGMNVTVPHKQAVMPLLDRVDERAAAIGAVNTIRNDGGTLTGFNTDLDGFLRPLREHGFRLDGARAVVVGAGGAARAVAFALFWEGVADLVIAARRPEQAEALADDVRRADLADEGGLNGSRERAGNARQSSSPLPNPLPEGEGTRGRPTVRALALDRVAPGYDLLVNATSVGMLHSAAEGHSPIAAAQLDPDALVYDLVYNPPVTPLLGLARNRLGGLPMLVYQGAAAFELWTGQKPPIGLMMARAQEALTPR
jgi:shikimate dehydrogenase